MFCSLAYSPPEDVVRNFDLLKNWNGLYPVLETSGYIQYFEKTFVRRMGPAGPEGLFKIELWNLYQ